MYHLFLFGLGLEKSVDLQSASLNLEHFVRLPTSFHAFCQTCASTNLYVSLSIFHCLGLSSSFCVIVCCYSRRSSLRTVNTSPTKGISFLPVHPSFQWHEQAASQTPHSHFVCSLSHGHDYFPLASGLHISSYLLAFKFGTFDPPYFHYSSMSLKFPVYSFTYT